MMIDAMRLIDPAGALPFLITLTPERERPTGHSRFRAGHQEE